jgi:hypothetical protein
LNKNAEKQYQDALTKFDFEKVQKTMKSLGWKWYGSKFPPSVDEMKETCNELFEISIRDHLKDNKDISWRTGGFQLDINDYGVEIKFVASRSDSYIE